MRTATAETRPLSDTRDTPMHIPGYRLCVLLHQSDRATIYRGVREADGKPVVLKILHDRALNAENSGCYRHEYDILQRLQSPGVIQAYELKQEPTALALVLEDPGGRSLQELIDARDASLTLDRKLKLALKMVTALRDVHAANIVHKDINPNNIVVNLQTEELKLIDFGLATPLAREQAITVIPSLLSGTLSYIAPEQTGRMNRAVDYRSDFYSLGATLYELFVGQPPFTGRDALELIHGHIARQPTPPHELNPHIPEPVSAIILKLLAKTAEERYQSIWSLEQDLQRCLEDWQRDGAVAPFAVDQSGLCDRFELPQKLYGRDVEVATLLTAFDAASNAAPQVLFVTGHSGIGKTSLVREVYKPITAKRGYLGAGKFDQYERDIPYSAVLAALSGLMRQFLSESEPQVAHWRASLESALGTSARVLTELLPDLELIIGERPPVPVLGPRESQERLAMALQRFFRAICRPEHPVVLHLDDLQWADSASLGLLGEVVTDRELGSLLFIGSYRDQEVDAAHPVSLMRRQLQRQNVAVEQIALEPLDVEHVTELASDTFGAPAPEARSLAALVHAKTGGNPFFVEAFLKRLYDEKRVFFDGTSRTWRWDLTAVANADVTDNVVDFMARGIRELSAAGQRLLRLAACIGNEFDLRNVAAVAETPINETARTLNEAILRDFILPLDEAYRWTTAGQADETHPTRFRFAHDRVQQAAYAELPERDRARIHHHLGRLLLSSLDQTSRGKALLQVVNHLNAGRSEASDQERLQLAELNLAAGRQARATGAFEAAYAYFKTGLKELSDNCWEECYDLTLALNSETAAMAPLCGDDTELELRFAAIRAHARSPLDKMAVYETRIATGLSRRDLPTTIHAGLEALRLLGVHFPEKPSAVRLLFHRARVKLALWGRAPERLIDHPRMTDPVRIAESRILLMLCTSFYWSNRDLLALALYRFLYICVKFGNSDAAPSVYAYYAMALCAGKDTAAGYRFGRLALALLDKVAASDQRPWVSCMVHGSVEHWKRHCRESLPVLLETYREALDVGDMPAAGTALMFNSVIGFHAGEPLPSLRATLQSYADKLRSTKDRRNAGILELYRDAAACLSEINGPAGCLAADSESSEEDYRRAEKKHSYTFHFFRGFLALHFGNDERAHQAFEQAHRYAHTVVGVLRFGDMYDGLSRVMIHPKLDRHAQRANRAAIRRIIARLKIFGADCPANYLHRRYLLEAEFARLEGRNSDAAEHYDRAIESAQSSGHVHEEALANELAARYYLAQRRIKIAQTYMGEARALYTRWGAARKVQWLDTAYPQCCTASLRRSTSVDSATYSQTLATVNLDLPALMKALKAIAEKTVHSQILQETIDVVMQFAGAEKALLLLRGTGDALLIEADADTSRAQAELMKSIPLEHSRRLCHAVVNYVRRRKTSAVIQDAQEPQSLIPGLHNDYYVQENAVRSILCVPITTGGEDGTELIGVLYVENNASSHTFTERRLETLELICLSVASRLELSRKAVMDSLTGLYNRGYFQNNLAKEFSAARRKQRPLSLVMLDIDHFKKVNDKWGHQAGDAILKYVATRLKSGCRESDVVARYGGEEMIVILPETNVQQAAEVADRIRRNLAEQPFSDDGETIPVTASFGVATNDPRHDTIESLIEAADRALYESKKNGRNRVTIA